MSPTTAIGLINLEPHAFSQDKLHLFENWPVCYSVLLDVNFKIEIKFLGKLQKLYPR